MFPRDTVCLRNISVDTLLKGDTEDDDDNDDNDDDDDNNNNNNKSSAQYIAVTGARPLRTTAKHFAISFQYCSRPELSCNIRKLLCDCFTADSNICGLMKRVM
jgi:hypothetical protein